MALHPNFPESPHAIPDPADEALRESSSNGRPVAVLLSVEDDKELERIVLAYSPEFQETLQTARQQIREGEGIPHDEFWREMEAEPQ